MPLSTDWVLIRKHNAALWLSARLRGVLRPSCWSTSLCRSTTIRTRTLSLSFYQCRGPSTRLLVARRGRLVVVRCEVGGDARRYGHGEPGSGGSVLACVRLSWQDSSTSLARSARICARVSRTEVGGEPISCSREAVRPPGCVASPGREGAPCNPATFRSRGRDVFAPPPSAGDGPRGSLLAHRRSARVTPDGRRYGSGGSVAAACMARATRSAGRVATA